MIYGKDKYVLTLPKGRLNDAFNCARFFRSFIHMKQVHETRTLRGYSSFYLPACVLPWNISPVKKQYE